MCYTANVSPCTPNFLVRLRCLPPTTARSSGNACIAKPLLTAGRTISIRRPETSGPSSFYASSESQCPSRHRPLGVRRRER